MLEAAPFLPVSQLMAGKTLSLGLSNAVRTAWQLSSTDSTIWSPAPVLSVAVTLFRGLGGHSLGFPPEGKSARMWSAGLQAKGHTCHEGYSR